MGEQGDFTAIKHYAKTVIDNFERMIVGKRDAIEMLIVAQLCKGHVLIEATAGTGKTMMARSIAIYLGIDFKRLPCTPDLLPNDVTGIPIYN